MYTAIISPIYPPTESIFQEQFPRKSIKRVSVFHCHFDFDFGDNSGGGGGGGVTEI